MGEIEPVLWRPHPCPNCRANQGLTRINEPLTGSFEEEGIKKIWVKILCNGCKYKWIEAMESAFSRTRKFATASATAAMVMDHDWGMGWDWSWTDVIDRLRHEVDSFTLFPDKR